MSIDLAQSLIPHWRASYSDNDSTVESTAYIWKDENITSRFFFSLKNNIPLLFQNSFYKLQYTASCCVYDKQSLSTQGILTAAAQEGYHWYKVSHINCSPKIFNSSPWKRITWLKERLSTIEWDSSRWMFILYTEPNKWSTEPRSSSELLHFK